jgi:5'-3' exonuclease
MLERVFARLGEREEDVFASRANDIQKMNQHNSSRRGPKRPQVQAPDWLLAGRDEEGKANEGGSFKRAYYAEKFGIDTSSNGTPEDAGVHEVIVKSYLAGLEWVLRYYYSGVCSWNWFYPFHYAPMASDMRNLQQLHQSVRFEQGKPFKPFEQLLGCLPPRSCTFLPKSYQVLMTNSSSPIRDFYPADFRIDMNGKRNPWEGVNLLSFINEERLKDAISSHAPDSTLTDEEKQRNSFGHDLEYRKFCDGFVSLLLFDYN